MPKLIIANAYELYQSNNKPLTQDEINARHFYNLRFLWLLEPGDIIILPKQPAKGFLAYLAKVKQIDLDTLHVVVLDHKYTSLNSTALLDMMLIMRLQQIIIAPLEWRIEACYFNQAVAMLAETLHLTISPEWIALVKSDLFRLANSKVEFRKISIDNNIPIPEGRVCSTWEALAASINDLLEITGQVIIKQEYNASGKGNIGITYYKDQHFVGVMQTIVLNQDQSINDIAHHLWSMNTNSHNTLLIAEVYHPNKGTFTAQFLSPPPGQEPTLLSYSEILMESRWVGVQIPPHSLSFEQTNELLTYSKQFASIMQARGYQGYLCCDAIVTTDNKLLFTEINVRPGAETHAYVLAQHLFGVGYGDKMVILTRHCAQPNSFINLHQQLRDDNLLLNMGDTMGIIMLTVDDIHSNQLEYLVAAPDIHSAYSLEKKLNMLLQYNEA